MNCSSVKENLKILLAAEESTLPSEIAQHMTACAECMSFHRAESRLFVSVNAELRATVNRPAPPSLLPRVRQQLEKARQKPSRIGVFIPAAAVLSIGVTIFAVWLPRHLSGVGHLSNESPAVAEKLQNEELSQSKQTANGKLPARKEHETVPFFGRPAHSNRKALPPVEVLVGTDELSGFLALKSVVYKEPGIGKAILHPVTQPQESFQPIAPVELSDLEIRPLAAKDGSEENLARSEIR